jgi:hypothetical protein
LNPGNKIITESLDALNVILKVGEVKLT